ncbi:hypothetical protein V565_169890 [Rhizoctonia solani 123E]|uniref:WD40 domain protein n=1 Tax=Rhizoctonia solani 123E TaxID=1423351 RepID=A0A074RIX0_9AGAM|nr:hypothetical protein V565_169890 [Rhizoctonia solani 123E]
MSLPKVLCEQASDLTKQFQRCTDKLERLYAAGRYPEYLVHRQETLRPIFQAACELLQNADRVNVPHRAELLNTLQAILEEEIVEDTDICCLTFKPGDYRGGTSMLEDQRIVHDPLDEVDEDEENIHPRSHPFASFSLDPPIITATASNHSAMLVYDSRCEVSSVRGRKSRSSRTQRTDVVLDLQLSTGGSCLAVLGRTKSNVIHPGDRQTTCRYPTPWVSFHLPKRSDSDFANLIKGWEARFKVGLTGDVSHLVLNERRRLIFVADEDRIKSFQWASADEPYLAHPVPKHTMYSKGFDGPMASLANHALVRAGTGAAAIWYYDELKTHSYRSKRFYLLRGERRAPYLIGGMMFSDAERRYDPDGNEYPPCENSRGSSKHSTVTFVDDPKLKPHIWRTFDLHPFVALAAGRKERNCVSIDLNHGGKTRMRYQGHPGFVTNITTSTADPCVFLTSSCQDEYARLFDVRKPQPVLQLAAGEAGGECGAIALAHPDGIPTVFSTSRYNQDFKVWDIRSRACVYELDTDECRGSSVQSLTWDAEDKSLYALRSHPENYHGLHHTGNRLDEELEGYNDNAGNSSYGRIYRYSFKDEPKYSVVINEQAEKAEAEFSDEGESGEE